MQKGDSPGQRGNLVTILEERREEIKAACRRHRVRSLHAFGSALGEGFSTTSDIDLLVEFETLDSYARVDAYFGLRDDLRVILGREVDLVVSGAVRNPYIAQEIDQSKQMLYAA